MSYIILFSAVIIGVLIGELIKPQETLKKLFLTFSGAFLLAVTVFHILPEVYINGNEKIGFFIMLGVFIQILLEFISKGVEHAHVPNHHGHSHEKHSYTLPMFISISIHAFLEGAPVTDHAHHHHIIDEISNPVLLGVFIHKIPIASIIYVAFRENGYSKIISFLLIILFGLMTPAGSYLANKVPAVIQYSDQINAVVIGIFLHISTTILFESSSGHKFNSAKLLVITAATALVYFSY
ncbi:MAG: ZIP family metal transporter [Bacteroidota bacterium]